MLWGLLLTLSLSGFTKTVPKRVVKPATPFLIYYGWIPTNPHQFLSFAQSLKGYPIVILGSDDEWHSSGDLAATEELIKVLPKVTFYGYVDIGVTDGQPNHSLTTISLYLKQWRKIGARGVLLDCAGPDYGVSHTRLVNSVQGAHDNHLRVLVNSFNPGAVLSIGLRHGDAWLAENWIIQSGAVVNAEQQGENLTALPLLRQHHIMIWMTATDSRPPDALWVALWSERTVKAIQGQAIAVAGPYYSSRSNAVVPAQWIVNTVIHP